MCEERVAECQRTGTDTTRDEKEQPTVKSGRQQGNERTGHERSIHNDESQHPKERGLRHSLIFELTRGNDAGRLGEL